MKGSMESSKGSRNLKCELLNKRSQFEKPACWVLLCDSLEKAEPWREISGPMASERGVGGAQRTLLSVTLHCLAVVPCFCQNRLAQKHELKYGLRLLTASQHYLVSVNQCPILSHDAMNEVTTLLIGLSLHY